VDVGVTAIGGQISSLADRSSAHNDATQVVATYQPILMPDWHGGKPAMHFDGSVRFLSMPGGFADFTGGLTFFVVADAHVAAQCPSFLSFSNGGEVDDISLHRLDADNFEYEVLNESYIVQPDTFALDRPTSMTVVHHPDGLATST